MPPAFRNQRGVIHRARAEGIVQALGEHGDVLGFQIETEHAARAAPFHQVRSPFVDVTRRRAVGGVERVASRRCQGIDAAHIRACRRSERRFRRGGVGVNTDFTTVERDRNSTIGQASKRGDGPFELANCDGAVAFNARKARTVGEIDARRRRSPIPPAHRIRTRSRRVRAPGSASARRRTTAR